MKNYIFFCAISLMICTIVLYVNAQLEVATSGDVTASKNVRIIKNVAIGTSVTDSIALNVNTPQSSSGNRNYGMYSSFEAPFMLMGSGCKVGIIGQVFPATFPFPPLFSNRQNPVEYQFLAGVAGVAATGIGVYGATASSIPVTFSGDNYAGYFAGNVRVTGNVTATTVTTTSDLRFKENISELSSSHSVNILSRLNPVSFRFRKDAQIYQASEEDSTKHYGFIAQEVKEILPELVLEDGSGYLSVNYIELIPLLVEVVNTQQKKMDELQAQLEALTISQTSRRNVIQTATKNNKIVEEAVLYQNNPNPFSSDTEIAYQLPLSTQKASICIYNMNGAQVAEYPISTFSMGSVIISAESLNAGMYLYSLIADGKVIDTKRMILTK